MTDQPQPQRRPILPLVARGGAWVIAADCTKQLLALIRLFILIKLLAPEDFGLLTVALISIETLTILTEVGLSTALVQKAGDISKYLDVVWTVGMVRGLLMTAIVWLAAPVIADFFNNPAAVPVLRVMSLLFIIQAASNVATIFFQKELDFGRRFILDTSASVTGVVVAIAFAVAFRNVWALVAGRFASSIVAAVMSYLLLPYRPRLAWNADYFRELWKFGRWLLGGRFLGLMVTQVDRIFVGRLLGTELLGMYHVAGRISEAFSSQVNGIATTISFPAYVKLQDDLRRLRHAFFRVVDLSAFLVFPVAAWLFIFAPDFTRFFLRPEYAPVVPVLRVLSLLAALKALFGPTSSLFLAVGKPRIPFLLNLVRIAMMLAMVYPLVHFYGMLGAALATFIPAVLIKFWTVPQMLRACSGTLREFVLAIQPAATATAVMAMIATLTRFAAQRTEVLTGLQGFLLLSALSLAVYLLATLLFNRAAFATFRELLHAVLSKRKPDDTASCETA